MMPTSEIHKKYGVKMKIVEYASLNAKDRSLLEYRDTPMHYIAKKRMTGELKYPNRKEICVAHLFPILSFVEKQQPKVLKQKYRIRKKKRALYVITTSWHSEITHEKQS